MRIGNISRIFLGATFLACALTAISAECPENPLADNARISVEGRFINREYLPVHFSLSWRHAPQAADTFDIVLSGKESFRYVSAQDFRYVEFQKENARRQMAMHHLQEFIGESPLTWNHLESLSRGKLPCEDSSGHDSIGIHSWKDYDGIFLPAIIDFYGKGGYGSLWIRTVKKIPSENPEDSSGFPSILWRGTDSKSKVPLILQMH